MTFLARQAFTKVFNETPDDLDMAVVYDVSHNIAKFEVSLFIRIRYHFLFMLHSLCSSMSFSPD